MQVTDIQHYAPVGKSDHNVITFNFNCYVDYSKPKDTFNYAKGDYVNMRKALIDSKWCETFVEDIESKGIEDIWQELKNKIIILRDKYVPLRKAPTQSTWSKKAVFPSAMKQPKQLKRKRGYTNSGWLKLGQIAQRKRA